MHNPEFRRNLWLEFSGYKALATCLVLLIFLAAGLAIDLNVEETEFGGVRNVAFLAYLILVLFWGGRQAAAAVVSEIRGRTWDSQRLSALRPWTMTWGKLFGATAFTWSAGLSLLVIYAAFSVMGGQTDGLVTEIATAVAVGIVAQAVGLLSTLVRFSARPGDKGANVTLAQLVGLLAALVVYYEGGLGAVPREGWYGLGIGEAAFAALSCWFFAVWSVVGVYRRMRLALQFSNGPWVWLLFLVTLVIYGHGLTHGAPEPLRMIFPAGLVAAFTYFASLAEPKNPAGFRRMLQLTGSGRLIAASRRMPLWFVSYFLLILTAGGSLLYLQVLDQAGTPKPAIDLTDATDPSLYLIALLLYVTRDVGLMLILALRRPGAAVELESFVYWFVLYVPLPAIFYPFLQEDIFSIFYPTGTGGFALGILPILVQALLVALVVGVMWAIFLRAQRRLDR